MKKFLGTAVFAFACALAILFAASAPTVAVAGGICPAGTHFAGMINIGPDPTGMPLLVPLCLQGEVDTIPP